MNLISGTFSILNSIMKTVYFIPLLVFLMTLSVNAQKCNCKSTTTESNISVFGGLSIVDDGFITRDYNPLKITERWQYGFVAGLEYSVTKRFSLQLAYSVNVYEKDKIISSGRLDRDIDYTSLNLHALYFFPDLLKIPLLDPYLISGIGITTIDDVERTTLNLGAGLRIWIGKFISNNRISDNKLALDLKTVGHHNFSPRGGQLQHTVGLLYRF